MAAAVTLNEISKTYRVGGEDVRALDRVSLTVQAGEVVAITGPSGSGKSTLANVVGGLDRPDQGSVEVGGQLLSKASDRQLAKMRNEAVGFVFQSFNLQGHLTAAENVAVPLLLTGLKRSERRRRATEALAAVGLADRSGHKPSELSGGQRQRVAIARALVNEPTIVIADEPTGNLDSARGEEVLELLWATAAIRGATLLVITHDPGVAARAGRVLSVRDGKVTEGVVR